MQLFESPDDALHERDVEGLVVILEVHPARLARDVLFPLLGVLEDRFFRGRVERCEPHCLDL